MTAVAYGIAMPASRGVISRPLPLLLDAISASPTGAYATFRLRLGYLGPLFRVRRSIDNAEMDVYPADIPGNLLSFCGAGDGLAATFYDQSGNARHFTQATAASQPKIVSAGALVTTINGLPSFRFDGVDDCLVGPAFSALFAASAYSIFSLFRATSVSAADGSWGHLCDGVIFSGLTTGWMLNQSLSATRVDHSHHYGSGVAQTLITVTHPSIIVGSSVFGGGTLTGRVNGGAGSSTAGPNVASDVSQAVYIGRSNYFLNGHVCAFIPFNAAVSLGDHNLIGAALAAKAGVTWTTAT